MFNGCSRTLTFHPDAVCIYCGCENQLKVYGWEPANCFDTLTTGWSRVSDIAIAQKQLVCISSMYFQLYGYVFFDIGAAVYLYSYVIFCMFYFII